ncbi:MAG TPA: putative quinol monooxygenase [Acidobacteriaceae bacterium]|nr:putative quinol monooxygenase [Acidobacteriaceae bacterium]
MISFTVRLRFRPEDREDVAGFLRELADASRKEPGCVSYIPHTIESEPDTVLIYEQYRDEAAVEAHRATPHFKRFAIAGLYQRMLDRSVENLIALA